MGVRSTDAGGEVAARIRAASRAADLPAADLRVVELDVTSDDSVTAAYETVSESGTGLDVLVNNAGIGGTFAAPVDTVPADFPPVFGVNLLGPVRVTRTFLPLLTESPSPRLVMVSSGMGSFGVTADPERIESSLLGLVYPASKAALNMVTAMYAKALPQVRVVAVDPGYTATALNGFTGPQSVGEGTDAIVTACTGDTLAGPFFDRNGALPW